MNPDEEIRIMEQTRNEVIRFTNELGERLAQKEIDGIEYHLLMSEKLCGKSKDEVISFIDSRITAEKSKLLHEEKHYGVDSKKKKIITFSAAAIVLILLAIIGIVYTNPGVLTGYTTATNQVQEQLTYNRVFDHYTETQLTLDNLTSLRISGTLEGTGAKVKLRIDNTEYLVAQITQPQGGNLITGMATEEPSYALTTDKASYAVGETAYITITPTPVPENTSLYVAFGDETHKLDTNTYVPQAPGDYQVVALIVLPDDILRLETNFTVTGETTPPTNQTTNETNQTIPPANETINQTIPSTGYAFISLCTETCNIPEATNPILIIEPDPGAILTINTLIVTQNKENQAPVQTRTMPDINILVGQTANLDLNHYFTDPDGDALQYDINEIPEINASVIQSTLIISSENAGVFTAYIYATDGDKLVTSNTFQITIAAGASNETNHTINITGNETNQTLNETNITVPVTTDPCSNPDLNLRPTSCFENIADKVFGDIIAPITNNDGKLLARFNRFGNLIIRGILVQNATGTPAAGDFQLGYSERIGFDEITYYTSWISNATGNLYLKGRIYEEQSVIVPPQNNVYSVHNRFGIILGYFDTLTGDLYLKGNMVQLGKI